MVAVASRGDEGAVVVGVVFSSVAVVVVVVVVVASQLSNEPWTLRGGVGGECLWGRSVGRRAAGTYRGDLEGRNWRDWRGRCVETGDVVVVEMVEVEVAGE